eukprot:NODE_923_length_3085_cov_0.201273.p1 type:complete len:279 gc:universal NODE_923_length_3085_cov_0.201273:1599-763(-)
MLLVFVLTIYAIVAPASLRFLHDDGADPTEEKRRAADLFNDRFGNVQGHDDRFIRFVKTREAINGQDLFNAYLESRKSYILKEEIRNIRTSGSIPEYDPVKMKFNSVDMPVTNDHRETFVHNTILNKFKNDLIAIVDSNPAELNPRIEGLRERMATLSENCIEYLRAHPEATGKIALGRFVDAEDLIRDAENLARDASGQKRAGWGWFRNRAAKSAEHGLQQVTEHRSGGGGGGGALAVAASALGLTALVGWLSSRKNYIQRGPTMPPLGNMAPVGMM